MIFSIPNEKNLHGFKALRGYLSFVITESLKIAFKIPHFPTYESRNGGYFVRFQNDFEYLVDIFCLTSRSLGGNIKINYTE